jgi:hypothetical protein
LYFVFGVPEPPTTNFKLQPAMKERFLEHQKHDDLNFPLLAVIGVISTLLLVEIVVVTQAYFYNSQEEEIVAKQVSQPSWELSDLVSSQQTELNSYRWVDRDKQRVSIPIDQGIRRYVELEQQRAATRPSR